MASTMTLATLAFILGSVLLLVCMADAIQFRHPAVELDGERQMVARRVLSNKLEKKDDDLDNLQEFFLGRLKRGDKGVKQALKAVMEKRNPDAGLSGEDLSNLEGRDYEPGNNCKT